MNDIAYDATMETTAFDKDIELALNNIRMYKAEIARVQRRLAAEEYDLRTFLISAGKGDCLRVDYTALARRYR